MLISGFSIRIPVRKSTVTDYYDNVTSMMLGEIYLHNTEWKFNAIGNGVARDLAGLCQLYGVETN